jgi:uncharacterized protein (UPF0297 family)
VQARLQKEEQLKAELKETLREFYCELCNKQYKRIDQYEGHLSSYDHHHKKVRSIWLLVILFDSPRILSNRWQ